MMGRRYQRFLLGATLLLYFTVSTAEPVRQYEIATPYFAVTLDNPAWPDPDGALGCRFVRPGWITALYPSGSRTSLFHTRSVSRYHPAFGCAIEFLPELELAPDRQLKIGVGIIEPHPVSRFQPKPVELFRWQADLSVSEASSVLTARQVSGDWNSYGYELTVTVTVPQDKPEIVWALALRNTGQRVIPGMAYLHPFFQIRKPEHSFFRFPGHELRQAFSSPPNYTVEYRPEEDLRLVQAQFRSDFDWSVDLSTDRPLASCRLWHNGSDCFATEPFVALQLAPGETEQWMFRMIMTMIPEAAKQ